MSPKFQQNGSDPPTGTWAEPLRASALLHHSQSSSPLSLSHSAKSPTSHRNRNKNAIKPTNKQNESVLRYRSCQSLLLLLLLRTQRPVSRLHFLLSRCPDLPHCVAFIFYFDIFLVCQCSPFNFVFLRTRRIQVPSSYSILLLLLRYLPFNRENTQMTDTIVK